LTHIRFVYTLTSDYLGRGKASRQPQEARTRFADAEELFDGVTYTYEDDRLPYGEERFVTLGLLREVVVSMVHTEKADHIHIVSMRKATKREREIYFESITN